MYLGQARATNSVKYQNMYTNSILDDLRDNINNRTYPNHKIKQEHLRMLNKIKNDLRRMEDEKGQ